MVKKYHVTLTPDERCMLLGMLRHGTAQARTLRRAHILLLADDGLTDHAIMCALHASHTVVELTRRKFSEGGLDAALTERPRPGGTPKLDGRQEATLIAQACSAPPDGREHWTMQLLADRLVTLQVVEAISDETVRRLLKKTSSSPGSVRSGVSPR